MPPKAIFFDVGNTLVFADPAKLQGPLWSAGIFPTPAQLQAAERAAKLRLDQDRLAGKASVDQAYWENFYTHLLAALRIADGSLQQSLVALARTSAHWNRLLPGTREVLSALRRHSRLGVISNSDGGIKAALEQLGIGALFQSVTDSGSVGHEKPDARIFYAALRSLDAAPEDSLYVGDIYSVDYLGATAVGMRALLMDTAGVYRDSGLPRIDHLSQLAALVAQPQP